MRKIICVVASLLMFVFVACRSSRPAVTTNYERQTDTVTQTVEIKKYVVKPDSASILARLECDSLNNVFIRELQTKVTHGSVANLLIKNNQLLASFNAIHDTIYVPEKTVRQKTQGIKTVTITKTVNVLHWWQKWLMWAGGISIISILLLAASKWMKAATYLKAYIK